MACSTPSVGQGIFFRALAAVIVVSIHLFPPVAPVLCPRVAAAHWWSIVLPLTREHVLGHVTVLRSRFSAMKAGAVVCNVDHDVLAVMGEVLVVLGAKAYILPKRLFLLGAHLHPVCTKGLRRGFFPVRGSYSIQSAG